MIPYQPLSKVLKAWGDLQEAHGTSTVPCMQSFNRTGNATSAGGTGMRLIPVTQGYPLSSKSGTAIFLNGARNAMVIFPFRGQRLSMCQRKRFRVLEKTNWFFRLPRLGALLWERSKTLIPKLDSQSRFQVAVS